MLFEFEALKDKPLGIVGLAVESSGNFPVTLVFTAKPPVVPDLLSQAAYSVSPTMFGRQTSQGILDTVLGQTKEKSAVLFI